MITLSKGIKKPQNPDTGDIWFPGLESNAQIQNDHNHDGLSSQLLAITTQAILSASWTAAAGKTGIYVQTVTVPAGFSYDSCDVLFKLSSGEIVYPSIERVTSTTYKIYTTDNTLNYNAYYR